jgi:hypothetical protein
MEGDIHPILVRQLRKAGMSEADSIQHPALADLFSRVSRSYAETEQDR